MMRRLARQRRFNKNKHCNVANERGGRGYEIPVRLDKTCGPEIRQCTGRFAVKYDTAEWDNGILRKMFADDTGMCGRQEERYFRMKITNYVQEFITDDEKPFDSAHASTLLELHDGSILAAWFGGSWEKNPDVDIWTALRVNGVWEQPVRVASRRGIAMWNPVLFRREDGTILLFYKVGKTIPEWVTYYMESKDEGRSFSAPQALTQEGQGGRGPVKNKPIRLSDGTVLAPASLEGELWDAFVDISKDDCRSWTMSGLIPLRRVAITEKGVHNVQMIDRPYNKHYIYGKGIIQPTLWEDAQHNVHMLCRSSSSRIFRSDSSDGGKTWSLAYDTGLPNNNSGIDLVKLGDGRLILVYNPRENLPGYYKGPRTPLAVALSEDNGETFRIIKVLEDQRGDYCYPAVICNDKNKVMITYTWKREKIVYVSFDIEED